MKSTVTKTREFPALLMTALCIGASLSSAGCMRKMVERPLPSPSYLSDDVTYYAPGPEPLLAQEAPTLKAAIANH